MIPFDSIRTNGYPPLQSFFLISCRSRSLSRLNKLQCSSIRRNRNLLCRFDTRQSRDNHRHVIHLSSVSKVFCLILKSKGGWRVCYQRCVSNFIPKDSKQKFEISDSFLMTNLMIWSKFQNSKFLDS